MGTRATKTAFTLRAAQLSRRSTYLCIAPLGNAIPAKEMSARCGCGVTSLAETQRALVGRHFLYTLTSPRR
jgi:hypothetical protein